jgi:hypothetical protein
VYIVYAKVALYEMLVVVIYRTFDPDFCGGGGGGGVWWRWCRWWSEEEE